MPTASIQFTQGALVGGDGKSLLGIAPNVPVTLTDAAGAGATSWLWQCFSFPGPLNATPVITDPTAQVATFTPTVDGCYAFLLTRVDGVIVTVDAKFCGVPNSLGLYLPSAGITGPMFNIDPSPAAAELAGWMGREDANTNVFQDAILRYLIASVGNLPPVHGIAKFADEYYKEIVFATEGFPDFADDKYWLNISNAVSDAVVTVTGITKSKSGFTILAGGSFTGEVSWSCALN